MGNLVYSARTAEKCIWREEFRNAATVHRNGGVLVGNPVVRDGITLDGATQFVTYAVPPSMLFRHTMSIVVRFTPGFDWDNGTAYYLTDATNGERVALYKSAGNALSLYINGTVVLSSIGATEYGQYWVTGEENTVVMAIDSSGANQMYLNAHLVDTTATSYTSAKPTEFYVGANYAGLSPFLGTIHSLSILSRLLTQADVDAIQDGSLWTYPSRASVWLDFAEATARAGTIRGTTELVTDGDMEAVGTAAWTSYGGADIAKSTDSPHSGAQALRATSEAGEFGGFTQACLTVGKRYRIIGWARGDGNLKAPKIYDGTILWTGTTSTAWQMFDLSSVAVSATLRLYSATNDVGWVEFDDVSVVETDELLNDSDMEATGAGEWAVGSGAPLTKEGDPQSLRITKDAATQDWTSQNVTDANRLYHVVGCARGNGIIAPSVGNSTTYEWYGTTSTDWQYFNFMWIDPTGAGLYLYAGAGGGAGDYVEFGSVSVRPVLQRTLDKSPNGHVCLLGDGFTAAKIPDFKNPGFELDGVNQYMEVPIAAGVLGHLHQTIAIVFQPDFDWDADAYYYLFDSTVGARYSVLKRTNADGNTLQFLLGNTSVENLASAVYSPYWINGGRNVLIISGTTGNLNVWLNGHQIITADSTAWTAAEVSNIVIGAANNYTSPYDGEILGFYVWPEALSHLQVADLTIALGVAV